MLRDPPSAIFCATDRLAVGTLHAMAAMGLRAGRDVSVVGYDDLPVASYTDPPLTTIAQPLERAARRMVEMLLILLAGGTAAGLQEILPATLVQRRSDGAPRQQDTPVAQRLGGDSDHDAKDTARG